MIGLLVALVVSWALLRFISQKNLSVLGIRPTKNRLRYCTVGFLLAASTCAIYQLLTTVSVNNQWTLNTNFTMKIALASFWWTLKSVLFEELLFRGALLYIAIEKLGLKIACLLSAACFGIYHWFSYNVFGNPVQMIIIFLMTGLFGYALAFAFAKTKSVYLPIGVHFGWNLLNIVVFSNGPLGPQILVKMNSNRPEGFLSLVIFLLQGLAIPLLTLAYVKYSEKKDIRSLQLTSSI